MKYHGDVKVYILTLEDICTMLKKSYKSVNNILLRL